MSEMSNPTPRTWSRWLLIASLAVNLAVAGLAIGAWLHGGPGGRGMVRDLGFGFYDEALRPEDRDTLRAAMRARLGDLQASRRQVGTDMAAVVTALRAEPFDAAALNGALSAQQAHLSARMALGNEMIGAFLARLAPADRKAFADRLEQRMMHGRGPVPAAN